MGSNESEPFQIFLPPRLKGILLYGSAALLLAAGFSFFFLQAVSKPLGSQFVTFLVISLILAAPVPLLVYRAIVLLRAQYLLSRDGLVVRWGLRKEDLPMQNIQWVQLPEDLGFPLFLPGLHFTGFLRGKVVTEELGEVEFMAADAERLILIGTLQGVIAISPLDLDAFLVAFQAAFESGSLSPIAAQSTVPASILWGLWGDRTARWLLVAGLVPTLALLLMVSLLAPTRESVSIGFDPGGMPLPPVPSERLLLLPVLALLFYGFDLLVGVLFYGRQKQRPVAYLIWSGAVITSLLLFAAVVILF